MKNIMVGLLVFSVILVPIAILAWLCVAFTTFGIIFMGLLIVSILVVAAFVIGEAAREWWNERERHGVH